MEVTPVAAESPSEGPAVAADGEGVGSLMSPGGGRKDGPVLAGRAWLAEYVRG